MAVYAAAGIFLCFALFRLCVAPTGIIQRCTWGFALCLGVSLLLNAPNVRPAHDLTPLLVVLTHGLKLAALTCVALIGAALDRPSVGRATWLRLAGWGLAVQVSSAVLYNASRVVVTHETVLVAPGRAWAFALYNVIFALYGALCIVPLALALARHARRAAPGRIRTGLRLITLACCAGVLWTSWALSDAYDILRDGHVGLGEDLISTLMGVTVALVGVGGASARFWPDVLGTPARWLRARRSYHALEPLWTALHTELPGIALQDPSAAGHGHLPWRATFELYRRVVEIRDAYLALRPYTEPETAGRIAASPPDRRAVLEATAIAQALRNRRLNHRFNAAASPPSVSTAPGTLADETAWLLQVARAFATAPEVRRIADGRPSETR
ncbi:MAB_1171c family putative transporter [Streptomyces sp. NPDC058653]|uniref:MAB_1171c family putative transporter n=1 Tax=Streptomyces sp. NPDC058653 TaxID=3346576 RepID=UPI00364E13D9